MKKESGKLLIVDDKKNVRLALLRLLENHYELVHVAANPNAIPGLIRENSYDLILLDMNFSAGVFNGNEGLYWLREIQKIDRTIIVILITAYADVNIAVRAIKKGAADFIVKPWDNDRLLATVNSSMELRKSKSEIKELKAKQGQLISTINKEKYKFLASSERMEQVVHSIDKVAETDANVLILGENGTGKELVAREIHRKSKRRDKIFLNVDLGSISETLFESELFGYEKGAFTDAKEMRQGRFEIASGGTLFLDEIGNISLSNQSKLLSVIQNREYVRLGSSQSRSYDSRLICASNKNLKDLVASGEFREDLYFRINTIEIVVPPLRNRGEDILKLAEFYFDKHKKKYQKEGLYMHDETISLITRYHWPGNVRELAHAIERGVILSDSKVLRPDKLGIRNYEEDFRDKDVAMSIEEIEKQGIKRALKRNNGNIYKTAKELKIARQTLYNKMEKYTL